MGVTLGPEPATIVGAGIAGLTAALCLARAGYDVEILERAPRLEEAGAGLQLSPNALRVLAALGLLDRLRETGVAASAVTLRSGRSGCALATVPVLSADGTPYLSILRSDLQAALRAAVASDPRIRLVLDQQLVSLARNGRASSDLVTVDASGHRTTRAARPLVVAADGVRSGIAAALGLPGPVATGLAAYRTMLDAPSRSGGIEAWLGTRHHAVAYPVAGGRKTNLVAIGRLTGDGPSPARPAIEPGILLQRFAGWDPTLLDHLAHSGPITLWPLFETNRGPGSFARGIIAIGDAAHAMLPFAAQGAAMAIEDAAVLANAMQMSSSPEEAGERFAASRQPRLEKVRRRVAFHRFVYHLPPPLAWARNLALHMRPQSALQRDLAWLYDWVPPSV